MKAEIGELEQEKHSMRYQAEFYFANQRARFESVAREFEATAQDAARAEVGQAEAYCQAHYDSAISRLRSIAASEQQAQRETIVGEAEVQLQSQRDQIFQEARTYLAHVQAIHEWD